MSMTPLPSTSYMRKAHFSFSSGVPLDVTSIASRNSCANDRVNNARRPRGGSSRSFQCILQSTFGAGPTPTPPPTTITSLFLCDRARCWCTLRPGAPVLCNYQRTAGNVSECAQKEGRGAWGSVRNPAILCFVNEMRASWRNVTET